MLPPSDSIQHQHLKLAEALTNMQAIEVPPPPSYTATTAPVTNDSSFLTYRIDDDDDEVDDEDEEDGLAPLAPVTVHVDASVRIEGRGNVLILPAAQPNANANMSANAGASAVQGQPTSLRPQSGVPQPSPGSARAERLTSTVLSALQNAGVIGSGGEVGGGPWRQQQRCSSLRRPLELHVNASTSVSGERNVIYAGMPRVDGGRARKDRKGNAPATVAGLPPQVLAESHPLKEEAADVGNDGDSNNNGDGDEGSKEQKGGRKRRAESVSKEFPPANHWHTLHFRDALRSSLGWCNARQLLMLAVYQEPVEATKARKMESL